MWCIQTIGQVARRFLQNDEIRAESRDGFDIWLDVATNLWQFCHSGREVAIYRDSNNFIAKPEREQSFCNAWGDEDDSMRLLLREEQARDKQAKKTIRKASSCNRTMTHVFTSALSSAQVRLATQRCVCFH